MLILRDAFVVMQHGAHDPASRSWLLCRNACCHVNPAGQKLLALLDDVHGPCYRHVVQRLFMSVSQPGWHVQLRLPTTVLSQVWRTQVEQLGMTSIGQLVGTDRLTLSRRTPSVSTNCRGLRTRRVPHITRFKRDEGASALLLHKRHNRHLSAPRQSMASGSKGLKSNMPKLASR